MRDASNLKTNPVLPVRLAESLVAAAAAIAVCGLFVVIAARHGALGIARNDDWVYYRSAFHFAETGTFRPESSVSMLLGQVLAAQPVIALFGPNFAALQFTVALVGAGGLWASYIMARMLVAPTLAALCVGCLALGPLFGSLTTSFMTDTPAFTLQALTLLAAGTALRGANLRLGWWAGALVLGFAAFTIREYAIAAPASALAAAAWHGRHRGASWIGTHVALPASALSIACAILFAWRAGIDGLVIWPAPIPAGLRLGNMLALLTTLAFMALPATLAVSPRRLMAALPSRLALGLTILAGLSICLSLLVTRGLGAGTLLGNYLTPWGSYTGATSGIPALVIPPAAWIVIQILALYSFTVLLLVGLVGLVGSSRRKTPPARTTDPDPAPLLLTSYVGLAIAVLAGAGFLLQAPVFDRGMLPLVVPTAVVTLHFARRNLVLQARASAVMGAGLAAAAGLGLAVVDASATLDGAKWELAQRVADRGVPRHSIEGGYEWFGFHQPDSVKDPRPVPPGSAWWVALSAEHPICVTTRNESVETFPDAGQVVEQLTRRSSFGAEFHLVARRGPDSCPASG